MESGIRNPETETESWKRNTEYEIQNKISMIEN